MIRSWTRSSTTPAWSKSKATSEIATLLRQILPSCDAVIHLACISNDPSFELDPELGKAINFDCFPDLVAISKDSGVRRFVFASSSSVYGVKPELRSRKISPFNH